MRTLLILAAASWTFSACSVEPEVVPVPETVAAPAAATPAAAAEAPKTRVGVTINRDGGAVTVENENVDISVGNNE